MPTQGERRQFKKRLTDTAAMAQELSSRAADMSQASDHIIDGDGAHILTDGHVERLRVIRADLAQLLIEIGADPNAVVKG